MPFANLDLGGSEHDKNSDPVNRVSWRLAIRWEPAVKGANGYGNRFEVSEGVAYADARDSKDYRSEF